MRNPIWTLVLAAFIACEASNTKDTDPVESTDSEAVETDAEETDAEETDGETDAEETDVEETDTEVVLVTPEADPDSGCTAPDPYVAPDLAALGIPADAPPLGSRGPVEDPRPPQRLGIAQQGVEVAGLQRDTPAGG